MSIPNTDSRYDFIDLDIENKSDFKPLPDGSNPVCPNQKGYMVKHSKLSDKDIGKVFVRVYPKEHPSFHNFVKPIHYCTEALYDWSHVPVKNEDIEKIALKFLGFKSKSQPSTDGPQLENFMIFEKSDQHKISMKASYNDGYWIGVKEWLELTKSE